MREEFKGFLHPGGFLLCPTGVEKESHHLFHTFYPAFTKAWFFTGVIFTVGPKGEYAGLLRKCYVSCLKKAEESGLRTIVSLDIRFDPLQRVVVCLEL